MDEDIEFELPEDLTGLSDDALGDLHTDATTIFKQLADAQATAPVVAAMTELASHIKTLRAEQERREQEAEANAEAQRRLAAEINGETVEGTDTVASDAGADDPDADGGDDPDPDDDPDEVVAEEVKEPVTASGRKKIDPKDQVRKGRKINLSLSEIRQRAPQADVPGSESGDMVITASADIPGVPAGARIQDLSGLANAIYQRSKGLPISVGNEQYVPVATIRNNYDHVVSERTPAQEIERISKEISRQDVLVAAGGWCAPSEINYDFFDMLCDDGMIDLPTFGVSRGGIRYPVSPTLADVYTGTFDVTTNPWLWTEANDIAATGGSPTKPCVRVPCPSFDERRLECYGICLTAGNLTDNAYPEATQNQIRLLRSAHYHAMNARYISTMVSLSGAVITGGASTFGAAHSTSSDLPGYTEWAATDIRTRFGMCDDDVVEVVLPTWTRAVIRQDLARKNGLDMFAVTDAMINDFFDVRSIRVQWVKDWQTRGTDQPGGATPTVQYPDTVDFMIYPAGTFNRGNGMTLDLGVVRDSVLNETNDHTALWTEECHLIAKFGPISRLYRHSLCAAGTSGAQAAMTCLTGA